MDEKDFLKNFYERNRAQHEGEETGEGGGGGGAGWLFNSNLTKALK